MLTARVSTRSHRGQIVAIVNVLYRVGSAQELERMPLTITATVDPHYAVTPEDVLFERGGDAGKDLRREASITIAPNSEPAVRVLKAYSTHPAVKVEVIRPDSAAGGSTIHLVFDPSLCIAPFVKAEVVLQTDSKMEAIHRVPVRIVSKHVH